MELVEIARKSLEAFFEGKELEVSEEDKERYRMERGVFVTLKKEGQLRGCIGVIKGTMPVWQGVGEMARSAAFSDPRFRPLRKEELGAVKIEVTVLTVPELIEVGSAEEYMKKIEIGKDGLIIECDGRSGVLLPQVAVECRFDAKGFLDCLCEKAGLERGIWKEKKCKVYKFQGEVYKE